jgi:hypothetical protein
MVSNREILEMIDGFEKDLAAFSKAHQILADRALELESSPEKHQRFISWSGTQIVFHGLILCEAKTKGLIEDLRNNLEQRGAPLLRVVEEEDANQE